MVYFNLDTAGPQNRVQHWDNQSKRVRGTLANGRTGGNCTGESTAVTPGRAISTVTISGAVERGNSTKKQNTN